MGPVAAIKKSFELTDGHVGELLFMGMLAALLVAGGLFCLVVGLFYALPVAWLSGAYVYRKFVPYQSEDDLVNAASKTV